MSETRRVCHWCGNSVPQEEWCPDCLASFDSRPEPGTMTPDEREAEFDLLRWCEIPFDMIHKRIEQLMGRPVWTHELANCERLKKEVRWETRPATMDEVISEIPPEKLIII